MSYPLKNLTLKHKYLGISFNTTFCETCEEEVFWTYFPLQLKLWHVPKMKRTNNSSKPPNFATSKPKAMNVTSIGFTMTKALWGTQSLPRSAVISPSPSKFEPARIVPEADMINTATRTYNLFRRRLPFSHATNNIFRCGRIILPPAKLVGRQYRTATF